MNKYTVISDYMATGEGRTMSLLFCLAEDSGKALQYFRDNMPGGSWYTHGAEVMEGWVVDHEVSETLLSPALIKFYGGEPRCMTTHIVQHHFNYS